MGRKILAVLILLTYSYSYACERQGLYVRCGYYGQYINTISTLKVEEPKNNTINDVEIRNQTIQNIECQPANKYLPNYTPTFAANIACGYIKQSTNTRYRFELEAMYSLVRIHNINLYNGPLVLLYSNNAKNRNDGLCYGAIINNNSIENRAVIANIYYSWKTKSFSFCPYIGFGMGGTKIKVYEKSSISPAYQIKAGLNYRITKDTDLYIGYKHFGVIGTHGNFETYYRTTANSKFINIPIPKLKLKANDNITLSHDFFGTHGVEIGMSIQFN